MNAEYKQLEQIFKKINDISSAMAILHWDSAVIMPKGGAGARGDMLASLSALKHGMLTDKKVGDLIKKAEDKKDSLNEWEKANLDAMSRKYKHESCLPEKLVEDFTKACSECEHFWREARHNNDFKGYAPLQQKVLDIVKEISKIKSDVFECSPYNSLLDEYDPARKSSEIDAVFGDLKAFLPEFIKKVRVKQERDGLPINFTSKFPIEKQKQLGLEVAKMMGFDFNKGRLDVSAHPFTGGIPTDVRLTTRYYETDFLPALMAVIHEVGHSLYEQKLPQDWLNQPVGEALGMTIHESQSLFWEQQVAKNKVFLEHIFYKLKEIFSIDDPALELENFIKMNTQVCPSLIRVEADECTYPLHIITRYELEKAMIDGDMKIADIPDAWNQKYKEYLGIDVPNFAMGCMQDIHWPDGLFGYFPTYSLGAITASQFMDTAKSSVDNMWEQVSKGQFAHILDWLTENIHKHGSNYSVNQLIKNATGKELDVEIYKKHLMDRYL